MFRPRSATAPRPAVLTAAVVALVLTAASLASVAGPAVAAAPPAATDEAVAREDADPRSHASLVRPPATEVATGPSARTRCERSTSGAGSDRAQIAWLSPSPQARGDAGEAAAVAFDAPTNGRDWRLVDDAGHEARLPNRTLSGTVVLSPEPDAVDVAGSVHQPAGRLRLADDGDGLRLVAPDGAVVDCVAYDRARDGERYVDTADGWRWRHPSATEFAPVSVRPDSATAFVLPDAPGPPLEALRSAEDRLLVAGYTLTSDRVVDALIDAHDRGVAVAVLVEGSPVGGTSRRQVAALDRLSDAGVNVTALAGDRRRHDLHHPKYAVVDDRALVLTENWKPAGVGGRSSRGWGVEVDDARLADALAELFHADASGPGAGPWADLADRVEPVVAEPARGQYPSRIPPERVPVERATLLVTPDNAEAELTRLLRGANDSIRIQQVRIDGLDDPLLAAALDAARNGTRVELLLSGAWYAEDENRRFADRVEALAAREELPITVERIDPAGAFEKSHVKGAVVDDRYVVLGSLNWNPTALREHREVVVVLEGEAVASYYASAFEADRAGERRWRTPVGLAAAVVLAWLVLAGVVATRIRWRGAARTPTR